MQRDCCEVRLPGVWVYRSQLTMANVVVTLKLMPEDVEIDLEALQREAENAIHHYIGEGEIRVEQEPIAFGLRALKLTFVMDESQGGLDPLEDILRNLDGVQSVQVEDVRRAIG